MIALKRQRRSLGKFFDIFASNQEVQGTQKDIRKLLKIKERADPKIPTSHREPAYFSSLA